MSREDAGRNQEKIGGNEEKEAGTSQEASKEESGQARQRRYASK
jgi:hypothetical protein